MWKAGRIITGLYFLMIFINLIIAGTAILKTIPTVNYEEYKKYYMYILNNKTFYLFKKAVRTDYALALWWRPWTYLTRCV